MRIDPTMPAVEFKIAKCFRHFSVSHIFGECSSPGLVVARAGEDDAGMD